MNIEISDNKHSGFVNLYSDLELYKTICLQ